MRALQDSNISVAYRVKIGLDSGLKAYMTDSVVCVYATADQWAAGGQSLDDGENSCNDDRVTLGSQMEFGLRTQTPGSYIVVYSRRRDDSGFFNISVQTGCQSWKDERDPVHDTRSKMINVDTKDPTKGTELWLPHDAGD